MTKTHIVDDYTAHETVARCGLSGDGFDWMADRTFELYQEDPIKFDATYGRAEGGPICLRCLRSFAAARLPSMREGRGIGVGSRRPQPERAGQGREGDDERDGDGGGTVEGAVEGTIGV